VKTACWSACLLLVGLGVACTPAEEHAEEQHTGAVHWGYEGEEGPEHWAQLSEAYALCGSGTSQSPIDLGTATPMAAGTGTGLLRDYGTGALSIARHEHVVDFLDNGHTIQVTYDEGSTLTVGNIEYHLRQFHFHAPSEHAVDGRHYPIELHLVHQSDAGGLVVLGVFIEEGEPNPVIGAVIEGLPAAAGEESHFEQVQIDVDAFMPIMDEYYRYEGSLTTPPCSEGVRWAVFAEPLQASAQQIEALDAAMTENNRPVQPIGSRDLVLISR
jgi:carbonic anhydrase